MLFRSGDGGQRHAQQAQEFGAADLGHAVGAVEQALGQEGEELDQGDAGVALGELRPLGRVHGHARQGVAHEVGVAAVVDAGDLERHIKNAQKWPHQSIVCRFATVFET